MKLRKTPDNPTLKLVDSLYARAQDLLRAGWSSYGLLCRLGDADPARASSSSGSFGPPSPGPLPAPILPSRRSWWRNPWRGRGLPGIRPGGYGSGATDDYSASGEKIGNKLKKAGQATSGKLNLANSVVLKGALNVPAVRRTRCPKCGTSRFRLHSVSRPACSRSGLPQFPGVPSGVFFALMRPEREAK